MKTIFLTACLFLSSGFACVGETLEGHLMPSNCQSEAPQTHTKACALDCKSSGFGILTAAGAFIRFDPAGDRKALAMLQATSRKADLKIAVDGTREGSVLHVESMVWK